MENPLIVKKRFANSIQNLTLETIINTFIIIFAGLQLVGQMTLLSHLIHLKPIPIVLLIIKSIWIVECSKIITLGLAMGLVGDILLMFPTMLLFEFGAVAFLIGHIFYISCFVKNSKQDEKSFQYQNYLQHLLTMLIFATLGINTLTLWNFLPNKGLFILYGFILSLMVVSSFYRKSSDNMMLKYLYGIIGSLCFLISDYIIAYTNFTGLETGINGLLIMGFYYTAQYMILKGNSSTKTIVYM